MYQRFCKFLILQTILYIKSGYGLLFDVYKFIKGEIKVSKMTFRLNNNGEMELVDKKIKIAIDEIRKINPEPIRKVSKFSGNYTFSIVPVGAIVTTVAVNTTGTGIFWDTFMKYIFPYMLDIAKVFCAIKIAQGFYNEKRGGRESGSGMETLVVYGKWYILFALMPYAVELLDQLSNKMLMDLRNEGIE